MKTRGYKRLALVLLTGLMVVSLLVAFVGFTGCAKKPVAEQWELPNIGIYSGPNAAWGLESWWPIQKAVAEINAAGGISGKPIVIKKCGSVGTADDAVKAFTKAVEGSLVILGPTQSEDVINAGRIAAEEGVLFINAVGSYFYIVEPAVGSQWGMCLNADIDATQAAPVIEWIKRENIRSVVIFHHPMSCQILMIDMLESYLDAIGVTMHRVSISVEATDVTSITLKALDINPDGFLNDLVPPLSGMLTNDLYDHGMTDLNRLMIFPFVNSPAYWDTVKHTEGQYAANFINPQAGGPEWQALVDAYHAELGADRTLGSEVSYNYDMVYMVKKCFEDLEITGDPAKLTEERVKIRDYMRNIKDWEGVLDTYSVVNGCGVASAYLFQVQNGRLVLVATSTPEMQEEMMRKAGKEELLQKMGWSD